MIAWRSSGQRDRLPDALVLERLLVGAHVDLAMRVERLSSMIVTFGSLRSARPFETVIWPTTSTWLALQRQDLRLPRRRRT